MENCEILIVGSGIVGLSTAYQLQKKYPGKKIILLEKEQGPGLHQSGNNSGVIHSGIYYTPGSMKAKNCLRGYDLILDFCRENNVRHEICGKIIVATDNSQVAGLQKILERGIQNGLSGLKELGPEELKEREPHVTGVKGLWVPQTGIIDFKQMMNVLAGKIIDGEAEIFFNQKLNKVESSGNDIIASSGDKEFHAKILINCAGLYSDKVAEMSGVKSDVKIIPFRGEYYKLKPAKKGLVKNLIYPVPDPNFPFLGVHFTRMVSGDVEAGPNAVLAYAREGYTKSDINPGEFLETLAWPGFQKVVRKYWKTGMGEFWRSYSKSAFTKALQQLIPEISSEDLEPGGAGVRAQACDRNGGLLDDFRIIKSENMIHVINAPSPAATSSLSIGEHIASLI